MRYIGDQLLDRENQIGQRGFLHDAAVETGLDRQGAVIANFLRGDQIRPESAGAGKVFTGGELRGMALPVAHAALIVTSITGDMVQRIHLSDIAPCTTDDHRHFTLIVKALGHIGFDQRLPVSDLCVGKAGKDGGIIHVRTAGFLLVFLIVQTNAQNFGRVRYHRQHRQVRPTKFRPTAFGIGFGLRQ